MKNAATTDSIGRITVSRQSTANEIGFDRRLRSAGPKRSTGAARNIPEANRVFSSVGFHSSAPMAADNMNTASQTKDRSTPPFLLCCVIRKHPATMIGPTNNSRRMAFFAERFKVGHAACGVGSGGWLALLSFGL